MAINFHNTFPDLFFFPANYSSGTFLKLLPVSHPLQSGAVYATYYRGANIANQSGLVLLTTAQLQALGNAIRMHLSTGSVSQTINGVQLAEHGDGTLDITFSATTTNLDNDSANGLASAVLRYVATGGPPQQPTDGLILPVDMSL